MKNNRKGKNTKGKKHADVEDLLEIEEQEESLQQEGFQEGADEREASKPKKGVSARVTKFAKRNLGAAAEKASSLAEKVGGAPNFDEAFKKGVGGVMGIGYNLTKATVAGAAAFGLIAVDILGKTVKKTYKSFSKSSTEENASELMNELAPSDSLEDEKENQAHLVGENSADEREESSEG